MTNFVKAVLFDLDGTLIDTAADFVRIIGKMSQVMPIFASKSLLVPQQWSSSC